MQSRDLVLHDLGDALIVLTLLVMIKEMKLDRSDAVALGETLRDVADEIQHRAVDTR